MNFLLNYGFSEEEIKTFSEDIPAMLLEQILNSYKLVSQNLDFLKSLGVNTYREVFMKFYDMFLMDNSNFMNIFNNYEREDLVEKINYTPEVVEFL